MPIRAALRTGLWMPVLAIHTINGQGCLVGAGAHSDQVRAHARE